MKRQCYNPYLPSWEYIPDAEPKVFGQRLYIYGSHDLFGAKEYCEGDYVCWSTPVEDLSDWRYEGVIFKKQDTPWNKENLSYYAPDVVRGTDGRYYLYYSVANTSITSVAVCDKPAGKYQYLGDVHFPDGRVYGSKPEDWFMFDPAVLVDDDGRVFLYVGSGQKSNGEFGHEIGHVIHTDSKDAMKNAYLRSAVKNAAGAASSTVSKLSDSELGAMAEALAGAQYSQKQETEADDYGFEFCIKNNLDPYAMYNALNKLLELSAEAPKESKFQKMFSSHPDTAKRVARAKEKADEYMKDKK